MAIAHSFYHNHTPIASPSLPLPTLDPLSTPNPSSNPIAAPHSDSTTMSEPALPLTKKNPPILFSFPDTDSLSLGLAEFVVKCQEESLSKRDKFRVALSGGSLPKMLAKDLVGKEGIKWESWEVFFADERLVPLDHPDSNYALCDQVLFSKTSIPPSRIHPIDASLISNPSECCEAYEQKLIGAFASKDAVAFPRFDLILLGMGPDGHTCSLFPDHPLLNEELRWVAWLDDSPKPPPERITLTFPVLNHAFRVVFVAAGEGKKEVLAKVLDKPEEGLPSSRVKPSQPGQVFWFVDDPAAKLTKFPRANFASTKL